MAHRAPGGGRIIRRESDDEGTGSNPASCGHREICGSQVDAIGPGREREIKAIVDEQERFRLGGKGTQEPGQGEHVAGRKPFFAQLQGRRAGAKRFPGHGGDGPGPSLYPIGDDDEAQPPPEFPHGLLFPGRRTRRAAQE